MQVIQQITSAPCQQQKITLLDGTTFQMTMRFVEMQYGWFFTSIIYGDFTLNNLRISNQPNMMHQFKNQIPFGIGCFSLSDREPSQLEDFSSGSSKLYLLSAAEVSAYSEYLSG